MSNSKPPLHRDIPTSVKRRSERARQQEYSIHIQRPPRVSMPSLTQTSEDSSLGPTGYLNMKRHYTSSQQQISQDVVQILKEENMNLKQQNAFLIQKLRTSSLKQQEAKEAIKADEDLAARLRMENQDLKRQIQYVHELTNNKVEEFGRKLAELSEQQPNRIEEYLPQQFPPGNNFLSKNQSARSKQSSSQTMEVLNTQFQTLLYECKIQQDPNKKKEYRKRLVELTNRMRQSQK